MAVGSSYNTFCTDGCVTGMTDTSKVQLFRRIRRKVGAPVMGVELDDIQIEECVCEAIEEFSLYINQWALENRISQMLGLPNQIDFTLKFVSNNFNFERSFATAYGDLVETSQSSTRELKMQGISLSAGIQNYFIPADREVGTIMWYTPNFINLFGLDPFAQGNLAFTEFGASFAGYTLYSVMPVFDTILTAQAAELRNKVRGSEYSYRLVGGPNGTKMLSLYPVPRNNAVQTTAVSAGVATPGTMYYTYFDTMGIAGNSLMSGVTANPAITATTDTQGNQLVSGPSDAKLYNLTFDELNDWSKTWVKKYSQANAKEVLGAFIRGKFSGALPIPDRDLQLNSTEITNLAREDMKILKDELKERLEKLNYRAIAEMNAAIQENINTTLGYGPLGMSWG